MRDLDLFGMPVSLTYKGKKKFGTLCGGFFSLFLILAFIAYAGIYMHALMTDPAENPLRAGSVSLVYVPEAGHLSAYNITTK